MEIHPLAGRPSRSSCRTRLTAQLDDRTAPLASALILGQREDIDPGDQRCLRPDRHDAPAGHLGLAAPGAGLCSHPALSTARTFPGARLTLGVAVVTDRLFRARRACPIGGPLRRHDAGFLPGRDRQPAHPVGQHPGTGGARDAGLEPVLLFDVGCQLSFLAIAALIWLVPQAQQASAIWPDGSARRCTATPSPIVELKRQFEPAVAASTSAGWQPGSLEGSSTSAVVWLAALPLVALRFHLVSPIGILLNIPLIPLTSIALLLGASGLGLGLLWTPLGVLPIRAADVLLHLTEAIVRWGVAQSWGHRFVAGPAPGWVLAFLRSARAGRGRRRGPSTRGFRGSKTRRHWLVVLWCAAARVH